MPSRKKGKGRKATKATTAAVYNNDSVAANQQSSPKDVQSFDEEAFLNEAMAVAASEKMILDKEKKKAACLHGLVIGESNEKALQETRLCRDSLCSSRKYTIDNMIRIAWF